MNQNNFRKVLFLLDCLYDNAGGGSEKQFLKQYENLTSIGVQPYVIFLRDQPIHSRITWINSPEILELNSLFSYRIISAVKKIINYIDLHNISIIHTLFDDATILGGILHKLRPDIKLICSQRNMGHSRNWLNKRLIGKVCQKSDNVVVNSQIISNLLSMDYGVDAKKIYVIENMFEFQNTDNCIEASELIKKLRNDYKFIAITVANLRPVKGIDDLLEAVSLLPTDISIALLVIGDGGVLDQYKEKIKDIKSLFNVKLLGYRADTQCFLREVDLAILPSRSEGASNSLVEYLFYQLPIVATNVGGNPDALGNGEFGKIVNSCDPTDLAMGINEVCKNYEDALKLASKGKEAAVGRYSKSNVMEKYQRLYMGTLN